jgi:hypothetical protein
VTRTIIAIGFGVVSLLRAADGSRQFVEVTHTENADLPSGGTLRLPNSTGYLTVEGWDRPDVEITTVKTTADDAGEREKATHEIASHHLVVQRHGDDLVVSTNSPWYSNRDLEYRIKAPFSARLIVNHHIGNVNVDGLTGDIEVSLRDGEIIMHLPEDGHYNIHAKCDIGNVNSDYPGEEKRQWWLIGHRIENGTSPAAPHKLDLRVKVGDIVILKARGPKPLEPLVAAPKANGS